MSITINISIDPSSLSNGEVDLPVARYLALLTAAVDEAYPGSSVEVHASGYSSVQVWESESDEDGDEMWSTLVSEAVSRDIAEHVRDLGERVNQSHELWD